jgi:hypothetical protein
MRSAGRPEAAGTPDPSASPRAHRRPGARSTVTHQVQPKWLRISRSRTAVQACCAGPRSAESGSTGSRAPAPPAPGGRRYRRFHDLRPWAAAPAASPRLAPSPSRSRRNRGTERPHVVHGRTCGRAVDGHNAVRAEELAEVGGTFRNDICLTTLTGRWSASPHPTRAAGGLVGEVAELPQSDEIVAALIASLFRTPQGGHPARHRRGGRSV